MWSKYIDIAYDFPYSTWSGDEASVDFWALNGRTTLWVLYFRFILLSIQNTMQAEMVIYISCRSESRSTILVVLDMYVFGTYLLTNERPGTNHATSGSMRALKKLQPMAQIDRHIDTYRRTWRLYDWIGPLVPNQWKA